MDYEERKKLEWDSAITVEKLIEELKKMPPGARMDSEGCDCNGFADHIELSDDFHGRGKVVTLCRFRAK